MHIFGTAVSVLVLLLLQGQQQQQQQELGHQPHVGTVSAFTTGATGNHPSRRRTAMTTEMAKLPPASDVWVLPTEAEVAAAVHSIVREAAQTSIAQRGHFALAIPGGSVLKILATMEVSETEGWPTQMTLAYVNHKCVPNDDRDRAIHAQARAMFLDRWGVPDSQVVMLDDSSSSSSGAGDDATAADAVQIASDYQARLEALPESVLPRHPTTGYPVFDLMLVGVGDDGHIGSLYPNQPHVDVDTAWTVGVQKARGPSSISLTLPVMQHALFSVVSAAGKSAKYPKGKADAMGLAISDGDVTFRTFPASALRQTAIWILDEPNASNLGEGVPVRTDSNYRERRNGTAGTGTAVPSSSSSPPTTAAPSA
jgi:6-phosphogluconolactonase